MSFYVRPRGGVTDRWRAEAHVLPTVDSQKNIWMNMCDYLITHLWQDLREKTLGVWSIPHGHLRESFFLSNGIFVVRGKAFHFHP